MLGSLATASGSIVAIGLLILLAVVTVLLVLVLRRRRSVPPCALLRAHS